MIPARYQVVPEGSTRVLADSEDEKRAREYADRWCRAVRAPMSVIDTRCPVLSAYEQQFAALVVYTAKPPNDRGVPLPRPLNAPSDDADWA